MAISQAKSDMSSENISRPFSFKCKEDDYSDDEEIEGEIQHAQWQKQRKRGSF